MKVTTTNALLSVRVSRDVLDDIDKLASAARLDRSEYVKLWLGVIARVKREAAVTAVTSIPAELLKGFPGRPNETAAGK